MSKNTWSDVITDLQSDGLERAVRASHDVAELANASHVPELYSLLDDHRLLVRDAAAVPLARLEGMRALPSLFRALTRGRDAWEDEQGLSTTIAQLLESNPEGATPLLLQMIEDPDEDSRLNAAWALRYSASHISPNPLFERIDHDQSFAVRSAATASLGSFSRFPEAFDRLSMLIQDRNLHVQCAAIAALGEFGDLRAVTFLRNLRNGASETIQFSIQFALERLEQGST